MLILECVEQNKECRGLKWGWATAHFQSWVATLQWCRDKRVCGVHGRRSYAHNRGPALVCAGVLGKACHDRPPWVLFRDKECPVMTEMARLVP